MKKCLSCSYEGSPMTALMTEGGMRFVEQCSRCQAPFPVNSDLVVSGSAADPALEQVSSPARARRAIDAPPAALAAPARSGAMQGADILEFARARLEVVNAEIATRDALLNEKAMLERMIGAAVTPDAPPNLN